MNEQEQVELLVEGVRAGDMQAARALIHLGPRALEPLLPYTNDGDAQVRLVVIEALARIRTPMALTALINALRDHDEAVAEIAAEGLASLGEDAIHALEGARLEARTDPVWQRRLGRVITAIRATQPDQPDMDLSHDRDNTFHTRPPTAYGDPSLFGFLRKAANRLAFVPKSAPGRWNAPYEAFGEPENEEGAREPAHTVEEYLDVPDLDRLVERLASRSLHERAEAVEDARRVGKPAARRLRREIERHASGLHPSDRRLVTAAILALHEIGDANATPLIRKVAGTTPDPEIREAAEQFLARKKGSGRF